MRKKDVLSQSETRAGKLKKKQKTAIKTHLFQHINLTV